MTTKTLKVTLLLTVEDMTDEELAEAGYEAGPDDDGDEPVGSFVDDMEAVSLAALVTEFVADAGEEFWAGSNEFAKIVACKYDSADWEPS